MRFGKLLTLILAICLIFSFTACDTLNSIIEKHFTAEDSKPGTDNWPPQIGGKGDNDSDTTPPDDSNDDGDDDGDDDGSYSNDYSYINIVMINDNHGYLNEESGSLDKIASGIRGYEALGEVVKVANGDMFQGTYVSSTLRGLPMLDALNALDFDAFVIGNHEFDWGFDEIKKYKDGDLTNGEAEFPFLGANIYDKRTGEMVDWLEPYTIVEAGDIKIGIIGVIGELESSILASHMADYDFLAPAEIVKDLASELRTDKECDVVIVAAHADDSTFNYTLATYDDFSKIDGILNGHSHTPVDKEITRNDGQNICVLQNGGNGESFATLTLMFDEEGNLADTDGKLNYTGNYAATGILAPVFEKYAEHIAEGETLLFTSDEELSRYDVGIEIAYSMYSKYGVDLAVINSGGVRAAVDAGDVTYADIFRVLPFENEVYIVTLTGELLKSYLQQAGGIYYWGIYTEYIVDTEYYELAIVDYVYLGSYFEDYRNDTCIDTNELVRDVFIEFILDAVS